MIFQKSCDQQLQRSQSSAIGQSHMNSRFLSRRVIRIFSSKLKLNLWVSAAAIAICSSSSAQAFVQDKDSSDLASAKSDKEAKEKIEFHHEFHQDYFHSLIHD